MNYDIIPYQDSYRAQWNRFVKESKNGNFQFDRNYMEYHKSRFQDASILIMNKQKIAGLFPANANNGSIYSHQGLTFGGLISDKRLRTKDTIDILNLIYKYYKEKNFNSLYYKTIPYIFTNYPADEDRYALFRLHAEIYRRDVFSVVMNSNSIRFSETKRQSVRKCENAGLTWREGDEYFEEYWTLLNRVLSIHQAVPVHNLSEILILRKRFPKNIKLFVALDKKDLIAGVVIYDYGNTVHTQYMANSKKGREIGALDYLNYKLIHDYYSARSYYSFGTSNEVEGKILNEGLSLQKELMGGRAVVHDFYKIVL